MDRENIEKDRCEDIEDIERHRKIRVLEKKLKELEEEKEQIENRTPSFRDSMYGACDRSLEINIKRRQRIKKEISKLKIY